MADILDQSEIDALLSAIDAGEIADDTPTTQLFSRGRKDIENLEIRTYDFKRPERVSKDQMRALQSLHEGFARNFGAALSGFLRTIVEIKIATCEQMTYGEFISGLPNPTCFNLVKPDGLEGQMCMEISPLIIYPIIDRLLGGTSQDLFIPQRPMTIIETRLIANITERGLGALSEAWESVLPLKFEVTAIESNPQLVQIVPPNEVVVVVGLELKMTNRAGTMNLCIPFNVIEPVMEDLASQSWFSVSKSTDAEEIGHRIEANVGRAPMGVSVVLAETTITMRDLAQMQPGDLIVTETRADTPAVVCVEKERKFEAHVGQFKGSRAVRVSDAIRPGDPD